MAFLDNSGDIILDAVLTDTGRYRLAQGNGSFKITKFALGDDEINYGSYNKNNLSGSAYYDLEILQTPVLEAFTNNTSTMRSKLLSIPRTNLLYLPVMIQNTVWDNSKPSGSSEIHVVCVDEDTVGKSGKPGFIINTAGNQTDAPSGLMNGFQPANGGNFMGADQGLNTNEISATSTIDADLLETQFIIEMDNRLGTIVKGNTDHATAQISFVDDDNIASYYFSLTSDRGTFMSPITDPTKTALAGPAGTSIFFKIQASIELQTSYYLFNQLGAETTMTRVAAETGTTRNVSVKYIDTNVKITGATTGYSINLPLRFIKRT